MCREVSLYAVSFLLALIWQRYLVLRCLDIMAVKKAVTSYEHIAGANIKVYKSDGLKLDAQRGGVSCLGLLVEWRTNLHHRGVVRAPPVTGAKMVGGMAQVGTWLRWWLFLKGRVEGCAVYIIPLILYCLPVLLLPKNHFLVFQRSLSLLLWWAQRLMVRR